MKLLSEFEQEYVAAVLDGEGNIEAEKSGANRIRVGSMNRQFLARLQEIIGGRVYAMSASGWKENLPRGQYYVLQLAVKAEVKDLLTQIRPHLIVKRAQTEEVISATSQRTNGSDCRADFLPA